MDSSSSARAGGSAALDFWNAFGLSQRLEALDAAALGMVERKERSIEARKKLAQKTKKFRAVMRESGEGNGDLRQEFGPLLKAYQQEIDMLTKRATASEDQFLDFYREIAEAPDPVQIASSERNQTQQKGRLQKENAALKKEIKAMELEFQNLKNQDITIRQLQTRIRELEVEMEERIADNVAVRNDALKTELDAERSKVQQELEVMQQNVDVVKASESESRERADEAQMEALAAKRQLDEARAKWKAEEESLLEEIERETGRTRQLHAQLEKLKVERGATQRRAQESVSDGEKGRDLEREVKRLRAALQSARASEEERAAGLEDKLLAAQRRAEEMQKSFHERIEAMRSEKEQVSADLADTKSELEKILAVRHRRNIRTAFFPGVCTDDFLKN